MERGYATYGNELPARRMPSARVVTVVLGAALLSSIVHYTDNFVNIEDYPQPHWINHVVIPAAWIILTGIGAAGLLSFRHERYGLAGLFLLVYSYTGLSSLAHYSFGPLSEFNAKMHIGIWLDGLTGAAVLVLALVLLLRRRR
jgi:hypothetical protein